MREIKDENAFESYVANATIENKYLVVKFTASWCLPCKKIQPIFENYCKNCPGIYSIIVDVDRLPNISEKYDITSLPTFLVIKEGDVKGKLCGANPNGLANLFASCKAKKL